MTCEEIKEMRHKMRHCMRYVVEALATLNYAELDWSDKKDISDMLKNISEIDKNIAKADYYDKK